MDKKRNSNDETKTYYLMLVKDRFTGELLEHKSTRQGDAPRYCDCVAVIGFFEKKRKKKRGF